MAEKKLLLQMEMFDEMSRHGLSPNQYYLLCCIKDSVTPLKINMHLELRNLIGNQWITADHKLTPKSISLIDSIEKLFSIQKKKTSNILMGRGHKENIVKYREMFPNIKLPTGKAARAAAGNLEKNFRWFFENFDYTWETVFKATTYYINKYQKVQWEYMRTSQYFIRKDNLSDLADYCDIVLTGGDDDEERRHSVKVV